MIPSERQRGNSGDFGDCREGVLPSSRAGDPCRRNGLRAEVLTGIALRTSFGSNGPVHRRLAGRGEKFRQPCAGAGHDPETGGTGGGSCLSRMAGPFLPSPTVVKRVGHGDDWRVLAFGCLLAPANECGPAGIRGLRHHYFGFWPSQGHASLGGRGPANLRDCGKPVASSSPRGA